MLKKTITYTDYNDNECTEDFYFNISMPEFTQYSMSAPDGDVAAMISNAVKEKDSQKTLNIVFDLIRLSYGLKSEDGKRFVKSPELTEAFIQSPAFDQLFFDLGAKAGEAEKFISGILPRKLMEQVESMPKEELEKLKAQISGN